MGVRRRRAAGRRAIGFVCILLLLFSFALVLMESGHDCTGDDCPVCALLRAALRRGCPDLFAAVCIFSAALTSLFPAFPFRRSCRCRKTPVLEKIRMND